MSGGVAPRSTATVASVATGGKPMEVVEDNALSHDEKKNALNTWEQDERQLLTASNEGMSGNDEGLPSDDDNRLGEVVRAKGTIGEKPKHKPSH